MNPFESRRVQEANLPLESSTVDKNVVESENPAPSISNAPGAQMIEQPESKLEAPKTTFFYRAYSSSSRNHFYTTDANEYRNATTNLGYTAEGIACKLFTNPDDGQVPLYRLYSPGASDHFYTTSAPELSNALVAKFGYTYEGIVGYVYPNAKTGTTALYRVWNRSIADHFYTTSEVERDNAVQRLGFSDEGVVAYVWPA